MGIYEDRQIHTKTGFRPIKLQESRSGPHTNRMPSNNNGLLTGSEGHTEKYRTAVFVQPELARAVLKDQGPVFLSMARASPVNKPFII